MRLRRSSIANLILLALSVTLTVVAAEVILRLALPQNFPVHPQGMYSADEAVGYALTPGFRGSFVRAEFEHGVSIGGDGLRGADIRPRRPNTFRIVCIGDSFTWGLGVGDAETFPHRLQRRLAQRFADVDIQVLNAGVPGYGTADELRFLESRGPSLDPDLVIVQFLADNDFTENARPALGRVEVRDGWLKADEPPRRQPLRTLDWLKSKSHLARFFSERVGYLGVRAGLLAPNAAGNQFSEREAKLTADLLKRTADVARRLGAQSIFVFATGQAPIIADVPMAVPAADVVARAAHEAGAELIDLTPRLRAREDRMQLYYRLDGHWSAAAHAATAEILEAHIAERHGRLIQSRSKLAS